MWRDTILTIAVLYVFHTWTLGVDSKMVKWFLNLIYLDMAPDSVDDMYKGCFGEMNDKVLKKYIPEEFKHNSFKDSWKWANNCANSAICAYTAGHPEIYIEFNKAVRTNKTDYSSSFKFHSLHFLLTDALRLLKNNRKEDCITSYIRTKDKIFAKVNQNIQFGMFTSSSTNREINEMFGANSCFVIKTCFGADLNSYSKWPEELEVLIPPYEVFNVTESIATKSDNQMHTLPRQG
uniref:NAD(P)(+)--arginine ADP-ribosyltransferase n=1 Tax=Esox lucius TaxID=8010 RepID=A0AAY5KZL1_ESOLU